MKKINFINLVLVCICKLNAQPIINNWTINLNGKKATYYAQTGTAGVPIYTYTSTTDSADVLKVCYTNDSVWIRCNGMTNDMGQYKNPGYVNAMNYTFRFPRTAAVPITKTISPKEGAIGVLLNGVPIYGLGNASSWTGTTNANNGQKVWNAEVGKFEGFVLDTAFGAHPQQAGAYHTHTTPYRYYKNVATNVHSPLVGYAFDGNPIYGPYGYSTPTDASSAVTRMISGYALRNITTRTTLPSGATASQTGPPVNATYPLGTYCEDYAWSAVNGGTLDEYNGRFCVTPEYPGGTYAYFVTISSAGAAVFPYYIGIYYYGAPDTKNFSSAGGTSTGLSFPTVSLGCRSPLLPITLKDIWVNNNANNNILNWQVISEKNVLQYEVEQSVDGKSFNYLTTIFATNNSGTKTYNYVHNTNSNIVYYRIKITDINGVISYTSVVHILRNNSNSIKVYPTIASSLINVNFGTIKGNQTISIMDINGKVLITQKINTNIVTTTGINISNLQNGMYCIVVNDGTKNISSKFLKQ